MKLKRVQQSEEVKDTRELVNVMGTSVSALLDKATSIQNKCHDYNVAKVTLRNV